MSQHRTYTYEGLFLFPQSAAADLKGAADHVLEILHRANAEVISFRKWDERRLAYEIKGNKRGVYFLAYFKAAGEKMHHLERDCNLSEKMLRALITRADHILPDVMQAAEGRQQLADEIKLRATQGVPAPAQEMAEATVGAVEEFVEEDEV